MFTLCLFIALQSKSWISFLISFCNIKQSSIQSDLTKFDKHVYNTGKMGLDTKLVIQFEEDITKMKI